MPNTQKWIDATCEHRGIEVLARDFNEALENDAIDQIILEIDSPGGQVAGVSEFADMVRAADKPVVAYVSDLGASAAYYRKSRKATAAKWTANRELLLARTIRQTLTSNSKTTIIPSTATLTGK